MGAMSNAGVTAVGFGAALTSVLSGIIGVLGTIFSSMIVFAALLLLSATMLMWVPYHDVAIEEGEHFMRAVAYPFYRDTARPVLDLLRRIWNPSICWFNAANWWAAGVVQDVIWPTFRECGGPQVAIEFAYFVRALLQDFVVDYVLAQQWWYGPADFDNICTHWIAFWSAWVDLYTCSCFDLGDILQRLPILFLPIIPIGPIPFPLVPTILFSAQWADPQTWCILSNLINAGFAVVAELLRLVLQILQAILSLIAPQSPYAQTTFTRPDFYRATNHICHAAECFTRSYENAIQFFWDGYIPYPFDFDHYFSLLDQAACFAIKTVNWVLTLLINIDRVVTYPANPFWETVMKPLTIENLNILGAPTDWPAVDAGGLYNLTNYYLSTTAPFAYPSAGAPYPNPLYGKKRLTEGVCIFISRTICDPTDNTTACYSPSAAMGLLAGFNFCCLTDTAVPGK